ncbi:MAG: hypothetical protein ACXW1W_08060 [Methylococcaceae bacterium]
MPLPSVVNGTAKRCHAHCKGSGEQCKNPCAYGTSVCYYHGARKRSSIKTGSEVKHFFKDVGESRAERTARPAKLKALKSYEKLLDSKTPIMHLPETDIASKVLNAQMDAVQQAYQDAVIAGPEGKMPNFKKVADAAGLRVVKKYLKKAKPL